MPMSDRLPPGFIDDWLHKAEECRMFGVDINMLDKDELLAIVVYLSKEVEYFREFQKQSAERRAMDFLMRMK